MDKAQAISVKELLKKIGHIDGELTRVTCAGPTAAREHLRQARMMVREIMERVESGIVDAVRPPIPADAACDVHTSGFVAHEPASKPDPHKSVDDWVRERYREWPSWERDELCVEGKKAGFSSSQVANSAYRIGVRGRVVKDRMIWHMPPKDDDATVTHPRTDNPRPERTMYPSLPSGDVQVTHDTSPSPEAKTAPIDPIAGIIESAIRCGDVATLAALLAYQWNEAAWHGGRYEALVAAIKAGADPEVMIADLEGQ